MTSNMLTNMRMLQIMHYPEETIKNFFSLIVYANESHSVSGLLMLPL